VFFPENPNDFNPLGLKPDYYPGSDNGAIIKWSILGTKTAVFEWNEDFRKGPHYHIPVDNQHEDPHYWPGDPVPDPYVSIYFP